MYKIAVVIPVYNRLSYTRECLTLLEQQRDTLFYTKNQVFTIVVDDGSTDKTSEYIRLEHPEVIVLQGNGNLWWSGSMNLGLHYAFDVLDCNFVLLWENDIFPVDNYFDNLQSIIEILDGNTIICSKVYYRVQPDIIFGMGGYFTPRTGKRSLIGRKEKDSPEYQKPIKVDWFFGQGILIHSKINAKIGYFDEKNFPQYYGDMDYALRAKKAGFSNVVYPNLKLLNDTATTGLSHIKNKSFKQFIESLTSIGSNTNIKIDLKFNRKHTTSIIAFKFIISKYYVYTASYLKWKFLGWFGIHRKNDELY